jgi:hypothetical protein
MWLYKWAWAWKSSLALHPFSEPIKWLLNLIELYMVYGVAKFAW